MDTAALTPLFTADYLRALPENGTAQPRGQERPAPAADGGAAGVALRDSVVLSFSAVERLGDSARNREQRREDAADPRARPAVDASRDGEESDPGPRHLGATFVPGPAEMVGTPDAIDRYDDNGDGHLDLLEVKRVLRAEEETTSYRAMGQPGARRDEDGLPGDEPAAYEPRRLSENEDAPPLPGENKIFGGTDEDTEDKLFGEMPAGEEEKLFGDDDPAVDARDKVYGQDPPPRAEPTVSAYTAMITTLGTRHDLDETA